MEHHESGAEMSSSIKITHATKEKERYELAYNSTNDIHKSAECAEKIEVSANISSFPRRKTYTKGQSSPPNSTIEFAKNIFFSVNSISRQHGDKRNDSEGEERRGGLSIAPRSNESVSDTSRLDTKKDVTDGSSNVVDEEVQMSLDGLKPGRLVVCCIRAANIRRKDQTTQRTNISPYVVFTLKAEASCAERDIQKESKVQSHTGKDPFFDNEIVTFDFLTPADFICARDIRMKLELRDSTERGSDLLGEATFSILQYLVPHAKSEEWISLVQPGDTSSNSKIQLGFQFQEIMTGMAVIKLLECKSLVFPFPSTKADVHARLAHGNIVTTIRKSATVNDGGQDPCFGGEELLFWFDSKSSDCFSALTLEIIQEHVIETLVGKTWVSLLPHMAAPTGDPKPANLALELLRDEMIVGKAFISVDFLEAGVLSVQMICGKHLRNVRLPGENMCPYVVVKASGKSWSSSQATAVDSNGNTDPEWDQTLIFDIVDQYCIDVECLDHDSLKDVHDVIGKCKVSLLQVFKTGLSQFNLQLQYTNDFGTVVECGQLHCVLAFNGPKGVAYPRHQSTFATFDDSHRFQSNILSKFDAPKVNQTLKETVIGQGALRKYELDPVCEFSEDAIRKAFRRIDLDNNGYIGASELKHMLVCMGELITDDEINMMISMLDFNGDGQVNFDAFCLMVKDPDPARELFGSQSNASSSVNTDMLQRKKQLEIRNAKRRVFSKFVNTHCIQKDDIVRVLKDIRKFQEKELSVAWRQAIAPYKERHSLSWTIGFDAFCDLFPVNVTAETKRVFELLDLEGSGKIDAREMLLSLSNFVGNNTSVKEKCQLMFELFDEDSSGFLSLSEIEGIMVGLHMQERSAIVQKAQTVMKIADTSRSGTICLKELIVAATKFPNLLLPNHSDIGDTISEG